MNEKTRLEYERLLDLFKDVDETKRKLVDELLKKAAFLKTQLDSLELEVRQHGSMKVVRGEYVVSVAYKTFLQSLGVYQNLIKNLNTIMGRNTINEDDEFDKFMESIKGGN